VDLPQAGRRVLMRLAGTQVAFIQPDDCKQGLLAEFLEPPTSGIYALVWRVEDLEAAETFFREKGVRTTREGCVSAGIAIDPRDFSSARHEFIRA
jgi:hypothetical protein